MYSVSPETPTKDKQMTTKILDRIRKLLELANSSNEHEAANAAGRAAELMIEHEISEAQIAAANVANTPSVKLVVDQEIARDGRVVEWHRALIGGLAGAFSCKHYWYRAYRGTPARYHAVGTMDAINAIRTMYAILVGEVDQLAKRAYGEEVAECRDSDVEAPSARGWKSAFRTGCANMISERLQEQRRSQVKAARADASKSQALMVIDQQSEALATFMKVEVGKLRSFGSSTAGQSSRSGYGAGRDAGRDVNLGGGRQLGKGKKELN